jgi:hypothetical protein
MADTLPVLKADKDYSKDADKLIPEAESLAQVIQATSRWFCVFTDDQIVKSSSGN